jgi:hypothetical protein
LSDLRCQLVLRRTAEVRFQSGQQCTRKTGLKIQ